MFSCFRSGTVQVNTDKFGCANPKADFYCGPPDDNFFSYEIQAFAAQLDEKGFVIDNQEINKIAEDCLSGTYKNLSCEQLAQLISKRIMTKSNIVKVKVRIAPGHDKHVTYET